MSYLVGSATELPPDQAGPVLPASAAPASTAKPAVTPEKKSIGTYLAVGAAAYAAWYLATRSR